MKIAYVPKSDSKVVLLGWQIKIKLVSRVFAKPTYAYMYQQCWGMENKMGPPSHNLYIPLFQS